VPDVKVKHFAAEARTLDAARRQALEPQKRLALAVALLATQSAQALDDLAEMFIKRMMRIHQRGKEALAEYRERQQERTDQLIGTLPDLVAAYRTEGTETERLAAIGAVLGFEVCVFSQLMWELKSGDVCVVGSDGFADYRGQLISWKEYEQMVADFGEQVGLPVEGAAFIERARSWLAEVAQKVDEAFPQNENVRIERGEAIIGCAERKAAPEELRPLERSIAERIEPINILDVLADTERWLNWTRFFGPVSKIEEPRDRYVMTTFCYGCGFGPSQAARALGVVDRRQLAWINQRHVTEGKLDQIVTELINGYNQFELPRRWGSGKVGFSK
jgi:Tn3 transposase DDE domain